MSARAVRHALLVTVFFVAATACYTYPLVLRPSSILRGGHGDYLTETSMVAWNALQTFRDPRRLFEVPFYYPYSNGVAYQQSAFFTGLLAAPILAARAEPLLAVNLVLLAELTASGVLTYFLAHAITGRVVPSLIAGLLFAFFPNRMDHLGQFTYQQAFLFPVVFWAAYRFVLGGARRHLGLAVIALWAQMLSSLYNGYALLMLLAALVAALLIRRPACLSWSLVGRAAVAGGILGLALVPFLWPYLAVHRELGFERTLAEGDVFGMDLLSILDPAEFSRFYSHRLASLGRPEGGLFPGFVALALAGAALLAYGRAPDETAPPAWTGPVRVLLASLAAAAVGTVALALAIGKARPSSSFLRAIRIRDLTLAVAALPVLALGALTLARPRHRDAALTHREWMLVLLFLALFTYMLCLAPTLIVNGQPWGVTLFRWVYLYLPGGGAFRAPGRWSLVFALPLALLAALGARAVAERLPRPVGRLVPMLLLAALAGELVLVPLPWQRPPAVPAVYEWLRSEPGDFAILQLPIHEKAADAWAMLWAIDHGKRVVNGHGGFALADWEDLVRAAELRDPDRLASAIRAIYPVRYVVVHRDLGLGRIWQPARELLHEGRVPGLAFVRAFEPDEVYQVAPTPDTGAVVRRHFSSDFVRQHPQVTYLARFAGADPEVRRRIEVRFNGRLLGTVDAPTTTRVVLTPPFPRADRNELAFHHVYDVSPDVARTAPYRVGRTGRYAPVDLDVRSAVSAGHDGVASVRVNGRELIGPGGRGYWVGALDPRDGDLLGGQAFDSSERLTAFVEAWPPGTIVVAVALDTLPSRISERALDALRSIGGRVDLRGTAGWSHALVGIRGAAPGEALEAGGPAAARVTVGKERPIGVTLEAFDLL